MPNRSVSHKLATADELFPLKLPINYLSSYTRAFKPVCDSKACGAWGKQRDRLDRSAQKWAWRLCERFTAEDSNERSQKTAYQTEKESKRESEKRKTALKRERERDSVNERMGVKESNEFASGNFNNKMLWNTINWPQPKATQVFKTKTYEKQYTKLKTNGILIKYLIQTTNKSAESNEKQNNTNLKQSSLIFEFDAK